MTKTEIKPQTVEETDSAEKKTANKTKRKSSRKKKKGINTNLILAVACIAVAFLTVYLLRETFINGFSTTLDHFTDTVTDVANNTEKDVSQRIKELAEQSEHVSNRATISIGKLQELADLEIMDAEDVEYVCENAKDNKYAYTRWVKVYGTATYYLNLKASEFIIDDVRNTVLVRVPRIEKRITIDDTRVTELLKKDDWSLDNPFEDKVLWGKELERRQYSEACNKIEAYFNSNTELIYDAEKSAETVLINTIKLLNPDNPDIQIDVDFVE